MNPEPDAASPMDLPPGTPTRGTPAMPSVSGDRLAKPELIAYGLLGLPLAAAALPVYVHLPKLYGAELGMDLALLGLILLLVRLADAFIDPWLGALADRQSWRTGWIGGGMFLMATGSILVFHPPGSRDVLWIWLGLALLPMYLGYSMASIHHLAWGSLLGNTPHERTRVAAWREGFALIGVVAASVLPVVFAGNGLSASSAGKGLADYSLLLSVLALICTLVLVWRAPRPAFVPMPSLPARRLRSYLSALIQPLHSQAFRWLLGIFMLNGIASALPATLVLFFIADVLGLASDSGSFLAAYFIAGAASLPLWLALSRRWGKRRTWLASMLLAVAAFAGAASLGPGAYAGFLLVCIASGVALGADLSLPPAMLADLLRKGGAESSAGAHAGLWNFATKFNLALAAGIALPFLQWAGYTPGGQTIEPLVLAYCLIPCVLKLGAAALLFAARLPLSDPLTYPLTEGHASPLKDTLP